MIKNRFFKTTQGVPFELAIGTQTHTYTDVNTLVNAPNANYDLSAFVVEADNTQPKGVAIGTALSAGDKKKPLFFTTIENSGPLQFYSTTPLQADTITAQLIPYKTPSNQVVDIIVANTLSTQQDISIKVIETTPGNQPLPVWEYTDKISDQWPMVCNPRLIPQINAAKEGEFFIASVAGPYLRIVSTDPTRHFKVVVNITPTKADPIDYGNIAAYTVVTPASAGSGTTAHLEELQKEANVRRGIGHYYTDKVSFGTTGSEFGLPVDIVALDYEWDIVVLTGLKYESSPTPLGAHSQKHYIFVAVPEGTGASIVTMFS